MSEQAAADQRHSRQILSSYSGLDLIGAASGFGASGGGGYCEEGIPTEGALLALLAAFAVSYAVLYMAATTNMATGRKKRDLTITDKLRDMLWGSKFN